MCEKRPETSKNPRFIHTFEFRWGQLSNKNADLRFLYEKFAKRNVKVKNMDPGAYILAATPHFLRKSTFIGNFFLETTFRL